MKKTVFLADSKGRIEALGVTLDTKLDEIRIYVNGTDISEFLTLERVEVIIEKSEKSTVKEKVNK